MSAARSSPRDLAGRIAETLAAQGAQAVVLVGSHAGGYAGPDSDLDLAVIGEGPGYRLEVRDGVLVSLGWTSREDQVARLYDPHWLSTHAPGWCSAVILHDPEGIAREIQELALAWSWELVAADCDRWVGETLTGLAEEVQKLVAALRTGAETTAAVQRSVLALRLPRALSIHCRILCGTENALWDLVADELGPVWRKAQLSALGIGGSDFGSGCRAALSLFDLAARDVRELLDERQRAVIENALTRISTLERARP